MNATADLSQHEVQIPTEAGALPGTLTLPPDARGVVAFAHGSGSSRHSPRNQYVAAVLHEAHLATLLFDLLHPSEARSRSNVFDIALLARRLQSAADWLRSYPAVSRLPLGYFGASTGAAAALVAAARNPVHVRAVVSRGGRPDLARVHLPAVQAPTLLIVGGWDDVVLELNRQALKMLHCTKELAVVPGATHLFEEPGTLEQAARLAADWFVRYLS
ncbi:MAG: dienelactone hydrolase family protein [Pirellulales bacterium]|nr:dienelactone hydrolase family protein [Pirellulales bacterium]